MSQSSDSSSDSDVDCAELEKIKDAVCDIATIGDSTLIEANISESLAVSRADNWSCDADKQLSESFVPEDFRRHIAAKLRESLDGQMRFKKLSTQLSDDNVQLNSAGQRSEFQSGFRLFSSSDPEWDWRPMTNPIRHYRNSSMNSSDTESEEEEEAVRLSSVVVSAEVIRAASLPLQLNHSLLSHKLTKKHKHKRTVNCDTVRLSVSSGQSDPVSDVGDNCHDVRDRGSNIRPHKMKQKRRADESKVNNSGTNKLCDLADNVNDACHKVNKRGRVSKCHRQKHKRTGSQEMRK